MTRTEWRNAVDFAEVAETLHVTTTQVFAVLNPHDRDLLVLYSPSLDDDERLFAVTLKRDADDVLVAAHEPVEQVGLWQSIVEQADRDLPAVLDAAVAAAGLTKRDERA